MIASLPMYDLPGLEAANDRFWSAIAAHLPDAPAQLDRDGGVWAHWMDPNLLFSQTCGLPFRARLSDKVTYIGTPDYNVPGCPPGYYTSVLIARAGETPDLATARFAYNDPLSQSGWNAPAALAKSRGVTLNACLQSGAHLSSAQAVANADADLAAIDVVTWRALQATGTIPEGLVVVDETHPTPGLPYIAGPAVDPTPIRAAVRAGITALSEQDKALLQICDLIEIPLSDYEALPIPPTPRAKTT